MEKEESKYTNIKIIYGDGNLREIVNNLMEEKMIDTLKKCENQ